MSTEPNGVKALGLHPTEELRRLGVTGYVVPTLPLDYIDLAEALEKLKAA
jgi:hypothetical protein